MRILIWAILFCFVATQPSNADKNAEVKAFKEAYAAYQQAIEEQRRHDARDYAGTAFRLGKNLFGPNHKNTAALALNYGRLLKGEEAEPVRKEALAIHEAIYGKDALEIIDPLMELAALKTGYGQLGRARKYYARALNITKIHDMADTHLAALINLEIGQTALQQSKSRDAIHYLKRAKKIYAALEDTQAEIGLAKAKFWIGKYKLATKSYKTATNELLASLEAFSKYAPNAQMTMTNHAFLIHAYEKRGMRDEATKHCRAIGAATPHDPDQDYQPVYWASPIYPKAAQQAGREGHVIVTVTVDEDGFIRNPKVQEREGHKSFEQAALEAVEKFRYVPRFENGTAVKTHDVKYKFSFELTD